MLNQNKCAGCGALKQTISIDKPGYVKDLSHKYCLECFSLSNYSKTNYHFMPTNYDDIKENSLILIVTSIFFIDQIINLPITKIQSKAKYVYLINQIDLLPKDTNLTYLDQQLKKLFKKEKIIYNNIIYMSALNKQDINHLSSFINNYQEKDIYLFGLQNSGKTTILKGLINNHDLLSLNKAGLTQEIMSFNFNHQIIHDMPGVATKGFLHNFFSYENYKKLLPSKTIRPKIYQIKNSNKLVINDFLEIKSNSDNKESIVFYMSDFNKIMKYNLKNENEYLTNQFEYVNKTFKIDKKSQITIADFLVIFVNGNYAINIKYPKGMKITIMESMLK